MKQAGRYWAGMLMLLNIGVELALQGKDSGCVRSSWDYTSAFWFSIHQKWRRWEFVNAP